MSIPTPAQAALLSRAWFGRTVPIAEPDGYRTPSESACLKRNWLARVPGAPEFYPSGSTFARYVLSPDGLRALAAFLLKAAGPSPSPERGPIDDYLRPLEDNEPG